MKTRDRYFRLTGIALTALIGLLFFAGTSFAAPFIVGHTGGGTITTLDFATGNQIASFTTDGAIIDSRGRGVEVIGNTVYYAAIGGDIHLAPYNGGLGGHDVAVFPNPRRPGCPGDSQDSSCGVQDMDYSNGILYALTGYYIGPPIVYALNPNTGQVIGPPTGVSIQSHPATDADGFTVLPNGNFLINDGDGSRTYREYNSGTGNPTGLVITLPSPVANSTGVDYNPADTNLYFSALSSGSGFGLARTTLTGTFLGNVPISVQGVEDISVLQSPCSGFAVNLVGNGSFETPVITTGSPLPAGSTALAPWYITGQGVDHDVIFQAADGTEIVSTRWTDPSALHQDLTTANGQMYELKFAATSERPEGSSAIRGMNVSWNSSLVASLSFDPAGHTNASMGWQYYTYNVMGTGLDTLSFVDVDSGAPGYGVALDDVSVAPVPEPPCPPLALYGAMYKGTSGGISSYTFAEVSTVDGHVTPLFDFTLPFGIGGMAFDPESGKFVVAGGSANGKIAEIDAAAQTLTTQTVTGLPAGNTYVQAIEYDQNQPPGLPHMLISFGPDNTNGDNRLARVNPATGVVLAGDFTGAVTADADGMAYSKATSEFIIADPNNVPFTAIDSVGIFTGGPPSPVTWAPAPNNAEYWEPACDDTGKMYFSKRDTLDLWYIVKGSNSYVRVGPHLAGSAWAHGLAFGTIPVCVPPPSNMVAWWPLDELTGVTAKDIVGGNNGTHVNGPVPLAGQYVKNALCFNGVNSYVEVQDAPALNFGTGDFSIDAWVKTTHATGIQIIVDKRLEAADVVGYSLYLGNGQLGFQIADGAGSSFCASCPTTASCTNYGSGAFVATGNWEHVAVTVSRTTNGGTFYFNGAPVGVFNPDCHPNTITNTNPLRIGSRSSSVSAVFDGCIDEVELFNRALGPCEIAPIFCARQAGKCKPCACLGDVNADGKLNGLDIAPFIRCLLNVSRPTDHCSCADTNADASVNDSDVASFVSILLTKQPCPP